ncbi:MAG: hypothetical protein V2A54_11990 [Bacteroidota bacterium]|jgi:cell division protein FtsQ
MSRTAKILIWTGVAILMVAVIYFTFHSQGSVKCKSISITIDSSSAEYPLMTKADISTLIGERTLIGKPMNAISTADMETKLRSNPWISKAEVYSYMSGEIFVNVGLRKPIVRVIPLNNQGYYLDAKGSMMPLSKNYTAKLTVASGYIFTNFIPSYQVPVFEADSMNTRSMITQLFILSRYIDSSRFWKDQIVQIFVNTKDEIELIPRVGNHTIILGSIVDLEDKFQRLYTFYKKGLNYVGWEKYSILNLTFKNQVVCTKKTISL